MRYPTAVALAVLAFSAAPAAAAPPPNDQRAAASPITLGDTVGGTVRDATIDFTEPQPSCAGASATVYYRFTPPPSGSVVVTLDAGGDLDAAVTVFLRERSELTEIGCDRTDKEGSATLALDDLDPEAEYVVQVAQRGGSDPGDFRVGVLVPSPPAQAPGKPLPDAGVKDSVDRLLNRSDIYNRRLQAGVPYRVSLSKPENGDCVSLIVSGRDGTEITRRCGGYVFFTPERSGRYLFTVQSGSKRGTRRYRLRAAVARRDDTTPGVFIRNYARVRGSVNGKIDSVDLYRFDVTRRSQLSLRVSGSPELTLLTEAGRPLSSGGDIEQALPPGRYFAAVRGKGGYRLRRISRVITRAGTRFNGRRSLTAAPGRTVSLSVFVRPAFAVDGRAVMRVERFDPLEGWQFLRRYRVQVVNGRTSVAFTPPSVGRYRASTSYLGSRTAAPSDTGLARLRVVGPLED